MRRAPRAQRYDLTSLLTSHSRIGLGLGRARVGARLKHVRISLPVFTSSRSVRFTLKSEIWAFGDATTDKSQIVIISR